MFVFAVHGNLVIFSRVGKKSREVCAPRPYPSLSLSLSLCVCACVYVCVCGWVCACVYVCLFCVVQDVSFFFWTIRSYVLPTPLDVHTPPRSMCTRILSFFGSVVCIGRCVLFSTTPDVYTPPRFMCTPFFRFGRLHRSMCPFFHHAGCVHSTTFYVHTFFSVRSFASVDVSFFPPRRMCTLHHVLCAHLFSVRS